MLILSLMLHATPAELHAGAAVKVISHLNTTVSQQGVLAANALAESEAGLAKYRQVLHAVASASEAADRQQIIAQSLNEVAADFIRRSCGASMKALSQLTMGPLAAKCRLYEQQLLPSLPTAYMQRASVLLAAFFMDTLRSRKASADEIKLAQWLAYLDAEGPALKKP